MEVAAISGQPWAGTNESLPEELMQHFRIECSYVLCQKCFCTCFCRWRQEFFGMRAAYEMTAVQGKQWKFLWPFPGPLMWCCSAEQSLQ